MILTHLALFSFLNGASPSDVVAPPAPPVAAPETFSGGWRRRQAPRHETETEREARIHAERVRMGILPPDPETNDELRIPNSEFPIPNSQFPILSAHLRPEDLEALDALAARSVALTIDELLAARARDEELVRLLRLDEQFREEDDAAVLMLAIATLH